MKKIILSLAILLIISITSYSQVAGWSPQVYNPNVKKIEENPLKGLIPAFPGEINNFPHSMEYFYIGLNEVMTGMNTFNWEPFETELNRISSQGKHAIFRFYVDYPSRPVALPQFLIDGGLKTYSYNDHGNNEISLAPNWKDTTLLRALENFVTALGAKYDGDPRISFITAGLFGFWGEWHNWPYDNWDMRPAHKDRLLAAFKNSFVKTPVQVRDALATKNENLKHAFGYHDDSFSDQTLGPEEWHFWKEMITADLTENWKKFPMGGEIYPPVQNELWENWPNKNGQDFETCVRTTHATWFMNHVLFKNLELSATEYDNAIRGAKLLGYEFFISSVKIGTTSPSSPINLEVKIQNKGVAPIYYNWKIEFAALIKKELIPIGTADWNINTILPDSTEYLRSYSSKHSLPAGTYKLVMRVINPLEAISKKAKPLRFANEKQDLDKKGWLTLGEIFVNP